MNSTKVINREVSLVLFVALAILAGIYLAWQLIGLRYTNHDDIYFNLYSWVFSGDYQTFVEYVARGQARLQAYINMPIYLWVTHRVNSIFYDVLNIGTFGMLYISLIWTLSKIGSIRDSLLIVTVTVFLFPLHYYYTFPQGYPVMGVWTLIFAFLSTGLLGSYLQQPKLWKLLLSICLFTCSLWGSEYNFLLHPAFLVVICMAQSKCTIKYLNKIAWPYVIGWIISITAYLIFSTMIHKSGHSVYAGTSFRFDIIDGLKTFLTLQQKAFLPVALWSGLSLSSAVAQGAPEIPGLLTFFSLLHGASDVLSKVIVFILAFLVFTMIFYWQTLSLKSIRYYLIFFACLVILPCLVLSGSAQYQLIILKGYIQGHWVSFYIQLGLAGFLFLFLALLCNRLPTKGLKLSAMVLSALVMASFATLTFIYNNINRQVMTANKQKWEAMQQLTAYVQSDRPDLKERIFHAPAFWSISGVSNIPGDSPFNGGNYWTEYVKSVFGSSIKIANSSNKLSPNNLNLQYFSTPAGIPLVILSEKLSKNHHWRITLIASQPIAGTSVYQRGGNTIKKIGIEQWKCDKFCVNTWDEDASFQPDNIKFDPVYHGPARLLMQFITSRNGQYGYPFAHHDVINDFKSFKILNWGPQETTQGVTPNLQPDGSAGIWIQYSDDMELGEIKLMLDNQVAKATTFGSGLITASIPAELFKTLGEQTLYIKQVGTGNRLEVGKLKVNPK